MSQSQSQHVHIRARCAYQRMDVAPSPTRNILRWLSGAERLQIKIHGSRMMRESTGSTFDCKQLDFHFTYFTTGRGHTPGLVKENLSHCSDEAQVLVPH